MPRRTLNQNTMSNTKKKNLFHSDLVGMTTVNPIAMRVDSEVKAGKNPAKSPNGYCGVTIDQNEYWLTIETPQIAADLSPLRGQTVWVQATGSRQSAKLSIMLSNPNAQDGDLPRTGIPVPQPQAQPSQPIPSKPKIDGARLGWAVKSSLDVCSFNRALAIGSPEWIRAVKDTAVLLLNICDAVEAEVSDDDVPF